MNSLNSPGTVLLSALLGGVQGGTSGYQAASENQKKYALEKLRLDQPPSDIKSLMATDANWASLPDQAKQQRLMDFATATSGMKVNAATGEKENVNPTVYPNPTEDQLYMQANNANAAGTATAGQKALIKKVDEARKPKIDPVKQKILEMMGGTTNSVP